MADPYHGLAADYDWIFDDGALAGGAAISPFHRASAPAARQGPIADPSLPKTGGQMTEAETPASLDNENKEESLCTDAGSGPVRKLVVQIWVFWGAGKSHASCRVSPPGRCPDRSGPFVP